MCDAERQAAEALVATATELVYLAGILNHTVMSDPTRYGNRNIMVPRHRLHSSPNLKSVC